MKTAGDYLNEFQSVVKKQSCCSGYPHCQHGYQPASNVDTSDPPGGVTLKDEICEHIKRIDKVYQSVPINGERAIECLKAKSTALLALSNIGAAQVTKEPCLDVINRMDDVTELLENCYEEKRKNRIAEQTGEPYDNSAHLALVSYMMKALNTAPN